MNFEDQIMFALRKKVISEISSMEYTQFPRSERKMLPVDFINDLWNSVDWEEVAKNVRPELQRRICNSIIGNMEKEIKTDVKALMSIDGVRQRLRAEAYPKIMEVLNDGDSGRSKG